MLIIIKRFGFFLGCLVLASCARQPRSGQETGGISPAAEYQIGATYLQQGDWERAAVSFNRAVKADPNFAEGYAGLAYILAIRTQYDKAIEYANLAVKKNNRSVPAQITKGRVYTMIQPSQWFDAAMRALNAALELAPGNQEAMFYKAEALFQHDNLAEAAELLTGLVRLGGEYHQQAAERLEYINARQKAAPQTSAGEQISNLSVITRADLASLLMQELALQRMINRRNPDMTSSSKQAAHSPSAGIDITDIHGLAAEQDIRAVVRLGAMNVFADRTFRPNEKVLRVNLAMTLQQVIILATGNRTLDTAYIGTPSSFSDVKPSHYAYNAICLVTEKGIMQANALTGQFNPSASVNGLDALVAIRRIQQMLTRSN
jgi:hypothetical protein